MGSDHPPQTLFEAVIQFAHQLSSKHRLLVIAEEKIVQHLFSSHRAFFNSPAGKCISFLPSGETIEPEESPLQAIRRKKNSSISLGIRLHADGEIDAFISPGNTGALILSAVLTLKCLEGIDRPALLATLPTECGPVSVLDVGANVSCKPSHLIQFAQMGAVYQRCSQNIKVPRVGLLNIGVEAQKGTAGLREAYKALESYSGLSKMHFVGNVEGRDVFSGKIDVLVTDGFTGNVFLKTAEGTSSFILKETIKAFHTKLPKESKSILEALNSHLDYSEYPGAILCGINGVVVKVHGNSGPQSLFNGIKGTFYLLQQRLLQKMKEQLTQVQ